MHINKSKLITGDATIVGNYNIIDIDATCSKLFVQGDFNIIIDNSNGSHISCHGFCNRIISTNINTVVYADVGTYIYCPFQAYVDDMQIPANEDYSIARLQRLFEDEEEET